MILVNYLKTLQLWLRSFAIVTFVPLSTFAFRVELFLGPTFRHISSGYSTVSNVLAVSVERTSTTLEGVAKKLSPWSVSQ